MQPFYFCNTSRVFFGPGCVAEHLEGLVRESGATCVMLAQGRGGAAACGALGDVEAALDAAGVRVVDFKGIMPNPTYAKVLEGAQLARREGVDLIVAVGGGSVMDCSKAISITASYGDDAWSAFWENAGTLDFDPIPVGVVVTAVGTGSEVNGEGVITNEECARKLGRDYPRCTPIFTMLDPAYTATVGMRQTMAGGFDAFTHVAETYLSGPDAENISDDISEALMRAIVRDLPRAKADLADLDARGNLMWASTVAELRLIKCGKSLDFGPHMIEHQLGAFTNCIHGEGLAAIYPAYHRVMSQAGSVRYARLAERVWGVERNGRSDLEVAAAGIEKLSAFIEEMGLPCNLTQLGVPTDDAFLRSVAEAVGERDTGYRHLSVEDIFQILCDAR